MTDARSASNNDNGCAQNRGSQLVAGPKALFRGGNNWNERLASTKHCRDHGRRDCRLQGAKSAPHMESPMNPMSILTLPAAALREVYLHSNAPTSHGERLERRSALIACLVAITGALVFSLA